MQNFGRGMWRRVSDYEKTQQNNLLRQLRIKQWEQFVKQQKKQNSEKVNEVHCEDVRVSLLPNDNMHVLFNLRDDICIESEKQNIIADSTNDVNVSDKTEDKDDVLSEPVNVTDETEDIDNVLSEPVNVTDETKDKDDVLSEPVNVSSEPPIIIPKKVKRKNKNKNKNK